MLRQCVELIETQKKALLEKKIDKKEMPYLILKKLLENANIELKTDEVKDPNAVSEKEDVAQLLLKINACDEIATEIIQILSVFFSYYPEYQVLMNPLIQQDLMRFQKDAKKILNEKDYEKILFLPMRMLNDFNHDNNEFAGFLSSAPEKSRMTFLEAVLENLHEIEIGFFEALLLTLNENQRIDLIKKLHARYIASEKRTFELKLETKQNSSRIFDSFDSSNSEEARVKIRIIYFLILYMKNFSQQILLEGKPLPIFIYEKLSREISEGLSQYNNSARYDMILNLYLNTLSPGVLNREQLEHFLKNILLATKRVLYIYDEFFEKLTRHITIADIKKIIFANPSRKKGLEETLDLRDAVVSYIGKLLKKAKNQNSINQDLLFEIIRDCMPFCRDSELFRSALEYFSFLDSNLQKQLFECAKKFLKEQGKCEPFKNCVLIVACYARLNKLSHEEAYEMYGLVFRRINYTDELINLYRVKGYLDVNTNQNILINLAQYFDPVTAKQVWIRWMDFYIQDEKFYSYQHFQGVYSLIGNMSLEDQVTIIKKIHQRCAIKNGTECKLECKDQRFNELSLILSQVRFEIIKNLWSFICGDDELLSLILKLFSDYFPESESASWVNKAPELLKQLDVPSDSKLEMHIQNQLQKAQNQHPDLNKLLAEVMAIKTEDLNQDYKWLSFSLGSKVNKLLAHFNLLDEKQQNSCSQHLYQLHKAEPSEYTSRLLFSLVQKLPKNNCSWEQGMAYLDTQSENFNCREELILLIYKRLRATSNRDDIDFLKLCFRTDMPLALFFPILNSMLNSKSNLFGLLKESNFILQLQQAMEKDKVVCIDELYGALFDCREWRFDSDFFVSFSKYISPDCAERVFTKGVLKKFESDHSEVIRSKKIWIALFKRMNSPVDKLDQVVKLWREDIYEKFVNQRCRSDQFIALGIFAKTLSKDLYSYLYSVGDCVKSFFDRQFPKVLVDLTLDYVYQPDTTQVAQRNQPSG